MEKKTLIHWFRKGLRIHDNPGLKTVFERAQTDPKEYYVRPIFILDPAINKQLRVGANRWRFLQESLEDLNEALKGFNSQLYVVRGIPKAEFPRLFGEWNTVMLTYEEDVDSYAVTRDKEIAEMAIKFNVKVKTFCTNTIYPPKLFEQLNINKAPLTYDGFLSITNTFNVGYPENIPSILDRQTIPKKDSWEENDPNCYNIPSLEELVKRPQDLRRRTFPGGETEALRRLNSKLTDANWVVTFEKSKTSPNSLRPSTTALSPYLKFGCLSSRHFNFKVNRVLSKSDIYSKPPDSLVGQLLWREYYYIAAYFEPNFNRTMGNSLCREISWQKNDKYLNAWSYGRTGYPFIDAIMRQLRLEGWIHHSARDVVACFLTRGDLWISWEEGQKVFEELLLDQDWALNAGNWMWSSTAGYIHTNSKIYNPVSYGKSTDREGDYIRKYIPQLARYPPSAIYEPWKLSMAEQRNYGCVLGIDYPHRIVDHDVVHIENIRRMNCALGLSDKRSSDDASTSSSTQAKKKK